MSALATALLNTNDIREIISPFGVSIQWSLLTFLLFLVFVIWWISSLEYQLRKIRNALPNIECNIQLAPEPLKAHDILKAHHVVMGDTIIGTPLFAKLLVANNPTSVLNRVDAPDIAAHIDFFGENGALFPSMIGRWANTKHQAQGALPNQVAQMTLHPNGLHEPLLIALKYTDEESAYGLNVDNEKMDGATKGKTSPSEHGE